MAPITLSRPRILILLIVLGIVGTSVVLTSDRHNYWGAFPPPEHEQVPPPKELSPQEKERELFSKLAIVFPVNHNTDMQFYKNMWLRDYLHPVCDFDGPDCKIVCNQESTYHTLDQKTFCFSRALKNYKDIEFFIKLDDDSFIDKDYIKRLMLEHQGSKKPVYISDHTRFRDPWNEGTLDHVLYGNGKFYMFNMNLVRCLDVEFKYNGPRNEDAVFGGMVTSGYVQEQEQVH
ncbi:hypothetical protein DL89DRAFT_280523 [Linderina pennispora]|uniref:Hexosyltransferase n=1 Tax=Linderina pennispora TaxID=61395 RepID=A0A1Y1WKM1_9FUNG|nr:uncharacterized protein DL89DRAFT_280523 [Linderina pennispora]ORX74023.1 hypothetical protein DL89DRAFT_280523 [Linderina pennispora]